MYRSGLWTSILSLSITNNKRGQVSFISLRISQSSRLWSERVVVCCNRVRWITFTWYAVVWKAICSISTNVYWPIPYEQPSSTLLVDCSSKLSACNRLVWRILLLCINIFFSSFYFLVRHKFKRVMSQWKRAICALTWVVVKIEIVVWKSWEWRDKNCSFSTDSYKLLTETTKVGCGWLHLYYLGNYVHDKKFFDMLDLQVAL